MRARRTNAFTGGDDPPPLANDTVGRHGGTDRVADPAGAEGTGVVPVEMVRTRGKHPCCARSNDNLTAETARGTTRRRSASNPTRRTRSPTTRRRQTRTSGSEASSSRVHPRPAGVSERRCRDRLRVEVVNVGSLDTVIIGSDPACHRRAPALLGEPLPSWCRSCRCV